MNNNIDTRVENITKKLEIKYLNDLKKRLNEEESDYYLTELTDKINSYHTDKNESNENIIVKKSRHTNIYENVDQYMFKRAWNRLPEVHKLIKIKEYVNKSLIIYDKEKKEKLLKIMFSAIRAKQLTRKGSVIYDPIKGRVISVPNLKYNKKEETYHLVIK
jgi:hypothetical protein